MSRAMLFVQNDWNGRPPRCVSVVRPTRPGVPVGRFSFTRQHEQAIAAADRWWLVEAGCAESGRIAIAGKAWDYAKRQHLDGDGQDTIVAGRIIACGEKL